MKKTVYTAMAYPPPPPPPPSSKGSRKALIAGIVIVVLIVAAVAGAYLLMSGSKPSSGTSPSPSQTTTPPTSPGGTSSPQTSGTPSTSATPSASVTPSVSAQPTATPGGSQQGIANFRAGAWANYTEKIYDEGTLASEMYMKESVDEGVYNGINCWLLITETDTLYDSELTTSKSILYLSKSPVQGIRMETYMNDILIYAYDFNETSTTDPGTTGEIDPNTVISSETITVAAGTFRDCMKAKTTNTVSGNTMTLYMWAHASVPVWGLVKSESYIGEELTSTTELTAYGG